MIKKQYKNYPLRGFTIIELLIVISIIGVLVGIATFALQGAQRAGRDAKRKSDLAQISAAVELYRSSCRTYPPSSSVYGGATLEGTGVGNCDGVFMQSIPYDAAAPDRVYSYTFDSATNSYSLCAALEEPPVPAINMEDFNCAGCGETCNYAVTSP